MGIKFRAPRLRLLQRVSTIYSWMLFLPRSSSNNSGAINGGMKLRSRSEENLNKLSECMDNMDDDVSKLFMEFPQTNLCEDPDLFRLLNDYFTTSKAVSQLCQSMGKCLEKAEHDECDLIDKALRDFEEEKLSYGGGLLEAASFRKTVQDLRNFNEFVGTSDFDCEDFLRKFQICHRELTTMIAQLVKTMNEIEKKLKRVRGRRAMVALALLAPLIAVICVSQYIAGLVPMEALTKFAASRWKKATESLKREKTAMTSMERGTMVALEEVEKITRLVSRLERVEKSIRVTAELAVKKRSSMAVAMGGMKDKRKKLKSRFVDLDRETGRCDGLVQFGRNVARAKNVEFLSRGQKSFK